MKLLLLSYARIGRTSIPSRSLRYAPGNPPYLKFVHNDTDKMSCSIRYQVFQWSTFLTISTAVKWKSYLITIFGRWLSSMIFRSVKLAPFASNLWDYHGRRKEVSIFLYSTSIFRRLSISVSQSKLSTIWKTWKRLPMFDLWYTLLIVMKPMTCISTDKCSGFLPWCVTPTPNL